MTQVSIETRRVAIKDRFIFARPEAPDGTMWRDKYGRLHLSLDTILPVIRRMHLSEPRFDRFVQSGYPVECMIDIIYKRRFNSDDLLSVLDENNWHIQRGSFCTYVNPLYEKCTLGIANKWIIPPGKLKNGRVLWVYPCTSLINI